jgi:hypothetical protein
MMLMMRLSSCILFVLVITLSGCIGFGATFPAECKNEKPALNARSSFYTNDSDTYSAAWLTKQEFLGSWGKPDLIKPISEDQEIWRYEYQSWCGVIPCFVICVPLLLPVCDGFAEIEFHENNARLLDIKRANIGMFLLIPPAAAADPVCRNITPTPLKQKIESGKTVFLNITYDMQKHQKEEAYPDAVNQISKILSQELVNHGIFKTVALDSEHADYTMDVTVKRVEGSVLKWSDDPPCYSVFLSVSLMNSFTKQVIGDFVVLEKDKYLLKKVSPSTTKIDCSFKTSVNQIVKTLSYQ